MQKTEQILYREIGQLYERAINESIAGEPAYLIEELNKCNAELARSGQLLADAKSIYAKKRGELTKHYVLEDMKPSAIKDIVAGELAEEDAFVIKAERLNAALTHRIDSLRSLLSYEKQQIPLQSFPSNKYPNDTRRI